MRYELRRLCSVRTTWLLLTAAVIAALVLAFTAATTKQGGAAPSSFISPAMRLLLGWPSAVLLPLPPAALAAGLLGALSFGQEFRYPALTPARAAVPRRLGMLLAKLAVSALFAVVLCIVIVLVNAVMLVVAFGPGALVGITASTGGFRPFSAGSVAPGGPSGPELQLLSVLLLCVGCAWAGLLAAGVFRSTLVGVAAVVAVPVFVAPAVEQFLGSPAAASLEGLYGRLQQALPVSWPSGIDGWMTVMTRMVSQPVGRAMALSLAVLLCAYLFTALRGRAR